ncbi:hypothetical protein SAMN04489712_105192 [Thermomonospora echinospora]|uniref:Uncharacterized protein n=1 Tax=Thermomonospora echinospora TaxID=1992 RepID=A0A1H6A3R4_9ACTN|nr:hypothetical protein SAMN04489712_105192 [Thermomonospora echinospora]
MRAVRVLLYVTAGLTVMAALDTWIAIGGASGLGQALAVCVPAAAAAALARRVARPGPRTWAAIVALAVCYLFWQFGRVAGGDPFGLLGLTFPIALIVCVTRPAAREHLRPEPGRRLRPGRSRRPAGRRSLQP